MPVYDVELLETFVVPYRIEAATPAQAIAIALGYAAVPVGPPCVVDIAHDCGMDAAENRELSPRRRRSSSQRATLQDERSDLGRASLSAGKQ